MNKILVIGSTNIDMIACVKHLPRPGETVGEARFMQSNGGKGANQAVAAARLGGSAEYIDYAASKGAIDTLTVGLAKEVAPDGIRVNGVRPGIIYTAIHASGGEPGRVARLASGVPMQRGGEPEEIAREFNGKALADLYDPKDPTKLLVKKGEQLASFAQLRDDGTTTSGCWIFAGSWTPEGNQMARRDNADPSGLGNTLGWAWAWPLNRRILYNRASADPQGKPWDPKRQLLKWDGAKWGGVDIPDYSAAAPGTDVGPFIMQPEGMGRLFALDKMAEGPFPEHYEPFETPLGTNPLHPNVVSNPAARVFKGDLEQMGKADKFPYVGTTYRLTEHFHYWTKHALLNAIAQPEQFVEIGEKLANKLGIAHGDTVKVSSNRGYIKAKAVVTKRIRTLNVHGQQVDTIGIPIHWGYEGVAKKGFIANTLTPFVGDANTQTPEFKAFLVNVEKV